MGRFLTIVARKIDTCNMAINSLQKRCKNLKPVQSCSTRCDNNVALKIVCRRQTIFELKTVVKNRPV